ncbi:MAG: hypothetical protein GTO40_08630, partial [Deltaproteobacteria bacterium]|nr:hypothetical protein [Deltaproteobacteria bacterium]
MNLATRARIPALQWLMPEKGTYIVVSMILVLGFFLIYPVFLILGLSFNTAAHFFVGEPKWGLDNWRIAFTQPGLLQALFNTVWLWVLSAAVSFPVAITTAWLLARTKLPCSHGLEFLFWVAYVTPGGLIAWIMLLDPSIGLINVGLEMLPFVDKGPFNIFSIPGIIFVNVVGSG